MGWELSHSLWIAGPLVDVQRMKKEFDVFWGVGGTPYSEGPRYAYECVGKVDTGPFLSLVRSSVDSASLEDTHCYGSETGDANGRGTTDGCASLLDLCSVELGGRCTADTLPVLEGLPHELFELCIIHAPPAVLAGYWVGDATENPVGMTDAFKDQLVAGCDDIGEGQLCGGLQYYANRIRKWDFIEEGFIRAIASQFPRLDIVCQTEDHYWMPERMECYGPSFPGGHCTAFDVTRDRIINHPGYVRTWGVSSAAVEDNGWRMWRYSEDGDDDDDSGGGGGLDGNAKAHASYLHLDKIVHLG